MNLSKNLQESFDLYFKNINTLLLTGLVATSLAVVSLGILAGPIFAGFMILCIKVRNGEQGDLNDIFTQFNNFGSLFLVWFLPALATFVVFIIISTIEGVLFLHNLFTLGVIVFFYRYLIEIINGIILSAIYAIPLVISGFATLLIINKKIEFMDALKQAYEAIQSNLVGYWLYGFVLAFLMCGIHHFIPYIGLIIPLFSIPIAIIGIITAYLQLPKSTTTPSGPSASA